ncbi:MAG: right-handed parallel beta-helix repeat-containing protein [Roseiflexus sp.]
MDPVEPPPDKSPVRMLPFRISRDTAILLASLIFLAFAILLAVLFPPSNGELARALTPIATIDRATPVIVEPVQPETLIATIRPTDVVLPATDQQPYPPPVATLAEMALSPTTEPQPTIALSPAPELPVPTEASGNAGIAPTAPLAQAPTLEPMLTPPPVAQPTPEPTTAVSPVETQPLLPTSPPAPRPTRPPPTATPVPIDIIRTTTYWTLEQSPITLRRDTLVASGAGLIIEPGVEVRIPPGIALYVDGRLYALGQAERPVRFTGAGLPRWEGIFGRPGSDIVLEHVEVRGGGAGGTVVASDRGGLTIRSSRITDNGGHVRVSGRGFELRDSEIAGNDLPYGAAVEIVYESGGTAILSGNRIGGNRMAFGSPNVRITNLSPNDTVILDVQRNLLVGQDGPNLALETNGLLQGAIVCNSLIGGSNGLSLLSTLPQTPGLPQLMIRDNAIEKHTPPIIPIYLQRGIGRGATSDVAIDMRGNWWGAAEGPYEPDRHADGRGDAPGDLVQFDPWLTERPPCAPAQ